MRQTDAMEPISRRSFLAGTAAVVIGACSGDDSSSPSATLPVADPTAPPGATPAADPTQPSTSVPTTSASTSTTTTQPAIVLPTDPFTLGVASGDAASDAVVLWTRLAPEPLVAGGGMPADDIDVAWEVALDPDFAEVRWNGNVTASATHVHSVHVKAPVETGGPYYYRFHAGGHTSPVGLTRTAPATTAAPQTVRFASASCQNYQDGYYTAHADIAAQQPEFVVFLGDYIYEGGAAEVGVNNVVRTHGTDECMTLDDYRNRYALYKSEPDLQAAHRAAPWYVIWDDHEVENNYAGVTAQGGGDAHDFLVRRRAAYTAWWEHQPVDLPPPSADVNDDYPIYRAMRWGDLLSVTLLDGRQYRSDQACGDQTLDLDPACPETFDATRTMIGDAQEAWLFDQLGSSGSVWNVIGQQTVFGNVTLADAVLNYDQWDGYPVQRNRIVDRLATDQIVDVVVLTGDIHFAGAGIIRSGARGVGTPVGVELVATSISSGGRINPAVTQVVKAIPDIVDVELEHRGYIMHTVTPDRWSAEYRMVDSVKQPGAPMFVHATYHIDVGTNIVTIA
jgi:alkaline phosphatase D